MHCITCLVIVVIDGFMCASCQVSGDSNFVSHLLRFSSLCENAHGFTSDEVNIPHDVVIVVLVQFDIVSAKVACLCNAVLNLFCVACSCYCKVFDSSEVCPLCSHIYTPSSLVVMLSVANEWIVQSVLSACVSLRFLVTLII